MDRKSLQSKMMKCSSAPNMDGDAIIDRDSFQALIDPETGGNAAVSTLKSANILWSATMATKTLISVLSAVAAPHIRVSGPRVTFETISGGFVAIVTDVTGTGIPASIHVNGLKLLCLAGVAKAMKKERVEVSAIRLGDTNALLLSSDEYVASHSISSTLDHVFDEIGTRFISNVS